MTDASEKKDALNYFAKSGKLKSLSKLGNTNYVHGVFMVPKLKLHLISIKQRLVSIRCTAAYYCHGVIYSLVFLTLLVQSSISTQSQNFFILGVCDRENPTRKH